MDIIVSVIVQALLTSIIVYLAANTYFHFHVSATRTNVIAVVLVISTLILMRDTLTLFESIYAFVLILILKLLLDLIGKKKKTKGFVLLNVWKKDFPYTKAFMSSHLEKQNIPTSQICYHPQKPFLIVFQNIESKILKNLMSTYDKEFQKRPKPFTKWHYLTFLGSILLIILIWRF